MRGSTQKRCSCAPEYDARGRRKACKRRHGSWSYRLDVGIDPATGKRRQERRSGFATQAEAEAALANVITRVETGRFRHDERLTLAEYLTRWLVEKDALVRATTMRDYRRHVEIQLIPNLGRIRLRELRTSQISALLRDLAAGGLGITSVRRVHATLRSALGDAVRAELVQTNAATNAVVPRQARPKNHPWEPEELGHFLDHAASDPFAPIFELIAMAGLRRGEAAGLRWSDIDLVHGLLVVRQQIVQLDADSHACGLCGDQHRGLVITAPKTASGEARRVDLGQTAAGTLLTHRLAQDHEKVIWGDVYRDHGLVFAHPNGDPIHPERITKRFGQLVKSSGLRKVRLHDLRHGRASMLLASGTDIALVSKMLGHSSITLTADTYSHLLDGIGRQAAEAADALIPRNPRDQSVTSPAPETATAPLDLDREGPSTCDNAGTPSGTRTPNPLIKSQLLCQLS